MRLLMIMCVFLLIRRIVGRDKPRIDYSLLPFRLNQTANMVAVMLLMVGPKFLPDSPDWRLWELSIAPAVVFFVVVDTWRRHWYMKNIYPTLDVVAPS